MRRSREPFATERDRPSRPINDAYAACEDELEGPLTPGKLADVVVLSRDIRSIPTDGIPGTEIAQTIVGGEICYEVRH